MELNAKDVMKLRDRTGLKISRIGTLILPKVRSLLVGMHEVRMLTIQEAGVSDARATSQKLDL